jgi:hypothetical protein
MCCSFKHSFTLLLELKKVNRQDNGSNSNHYAQQYRRGEVNSGFRGSSTRHNNLYRMFKFRGSRHLKPVLVIGRLIAGLLEEQVKLDFVV